MILGGFINAKFQGGMSNIDEASHKDANLLAGDAIANYRTVASFAHDEVIINKFDSYLDGPSRKERRAAHFIGLAYGFSQFVQNAVFALIQYAGVEFIVGSASIMTGQDVYMAMFPMMFGAMAAGQAN